MARSVDAFYGDAASPLPIGVLPDEDDAPGARDRLRRRRGLLSGGELTHLEDRIRVYLGL